MAIQLDARWVQQHLPARARAAHKGCFGTLALMAGSRRYRGAATLAAMGALRVGAGIVRLVAIEPVCAAAAAQLPCCTFLPVDEGAEGGMAADALDAISGQRQTAVLAGCGMGDTPDTAQIVAGLLKMGSCPAVLDADALNSVARASSPAGFLRERTDTACILTPHVGEMARLCGQSAARVAEDQLTTARDFAQAARCVVVLKSHVTVVAAPDGETFINDSAGNPGLAKGGSGDVLAGMIAGLLAQGLPAAHAAAAGVWLHAAAADFAAANWGEAALSPADLPNTLAQVLKGLGR